jgi:hypothetical protein
LTPQPVVRLVDQYGNAVKQSGVRVTVGVQPSVGHVVDGATSLQTDAQGIAAFSDLSLSGTAGRVTLRFSMATLPSIASTEISLEAGTPASLSAATTTALTGIVATSVSPPPSVIVKDAAGNGVPGISVQFALSSGGGAIQPTSATTDLNGVATLTSWTLPNLVGTYSVVATTSTLSGTGVTFSAVAQPAAASNLTIVSGDHASGQVTTTLPSLVVKVADAFGNAIAGATVNWAIASGGGTLGASSSVTDANGRAEVAFTLPAQAGSVRVTGSLQGGQSV